MCGEPRTKIIPIVYCTPKHHVPVVRIRFLSFYRTNRTIIVLCCIDLSESPGTISHFSVTHFNPPYSPRRFFIFFFSYIFYSVLFPSCNFSFAYFFCYAHCGLFKLAFVFYSLRYSQQDTTNVFGSKIPLNISISIL